MFEAHTNNVKNRLYLKVGGKMDSDEFISFLKKATEEAKKLRQGFGIISDITEFTVISEDKRQLLECFMISLIDLKVGHVVRIVNPRAAMVSLQWQRTSWKAGYTASSVTTIEDAEIKLDELERVKNMGLVPAII
jgi:hypothetical protein